MNLKHWWLGCREYNYRHPTWQKSDGKYPVCGVCGNTCSWMFGWKKHRPDLNAQAVMGWPSPDESAEYWARHDGWMA